MNIERQYGEDGLLKEVWNFTIINSTIFLNGYQLMEKESARHRKYKTLKNYDRLMKRESTITEDDVPFTDEIRQEALRTYFKTVKCLKWSEK